MLQGLVASHYVKKKTSTNNLIIVCSRDTTTPSRPRCVTALLSGSQALARLLPAILAAAPSAVVLADARSAALLAPASYAVVLANARPAALLAPASYRYAESPMRTHIS